MSKQIYFLNHILPQIKHVNLTLLLAIFLIIARTKGIKSL